VDNGIQQINLYPVHNTIGFPNTFHWVVIYPVDSAIQHLNNRGLVASWLPVALPGD